MATKRGSEQDEERQLRRGPWTLEEDTLLIHYIACHGEGRWNLLARCSGLKRTGKSCRLRWLNYLKPDVKRGNLTPEEQILILELHSKWGNRWSRIAQHLPGRTDNEIKNYWRTRVQKQAKQLKVDANSEVFRDAVRCYWMPNLIEKMDALQPLKPCQPPPPPLPPPPSSAQIGFYGGGQLEACTPRDAAMGSTALTSFQLAQEMEPKVDVAFGKMAFGREALVGAGEGDVVGGEASTPLTGAAACSSGDLGFDCTILQDGWSDGIWNNMEEDEEDDAGDHWFQIDQTYRSHCV